MRKVKIITDSCSDLSMELMRKYDIDYVHMITILDGKAAPASLDRTAEEVRAFYDILRSGRSFTMSQVTVEEFTEIFRKYLDMGMDIVYVACSSRQSGSVNTGAMTAKKLLQDYPGASVFAIDSLNSCIGEGMLAIRAAELSEKGLGAQEIYDDIMAHRKNINEFVTVHSLDSLRRAGRVKATSAFFGNLMGVKPVIVCDAEGNQASYKKVKGRQNSLREIVALLKDAIEDPEEQTIYLWHADCSEEEVKLVKDLVLQEIPCKDVLTGYIGPIVGNSVGPDTIGVWAYGKTVTYTVNL